MSSARRRDFSLPVRGICFQIRNEATPISIYNIVQATGKSQAGGAKGGWFSSPKLFMMSMVRVEAPKPTARGSRMRPMADQINFALERLGVDLDLLVLVFDFDFCVDFLVVPTLYSL